MLGWFVREQYITGTEGSLFLKEKGGHYKKSMGRQLYFFAFLT